MENKTAVEILSEIQSELIAPKNQFNEFGKYKYRNCEDILEALKPILLKHKAMVVISDEIVQIVDRFYVKATATIYLGNEKIGVSALAREPQERKGMDASQITGATSSYARKYALNGLFLIDDSKDPDSTNNGNGKALEHISEKQLGIIRDKLIELERAESSFCAYMKIEKLEDMLVNDFNKAMVVLNNAKPKAVK